MSEALNVTGMSGGVRDIGGAAPARAAEMAPDIRAAAVKFEAVFLAEMLKSAGLDGGAKAFGGGVGEDAFSSFLTREYATRLAESGGVGLADRIAADLARRGPQT